MPKWVVHEVLGELCGISKQLMRELNNFIDSIGDPTFHDANRVIIRNRWDPEALLYAAYVVLEKWGFDGLRAFLHHHLLDYAEGIGLRFRVHKTHSGNYYLTEVLNNVYAVLRNIEKDFKVFDDLLSLVPQEALGVLEKEWGVRFQYPSEVLNILTEMDKVIETAKALLNASKSLEECLKDCIHELIVFYLSFPKDYCVICKSIVSSMEGFRETKLGYKVHDKCFEHLKRKASELLNRMNKKEVYKWLIRECAIPASLAHQLVY